MIPILHWWVPRRITGRRFSNASKPKEFPPRYEILSAPPPNPRMMEVDLSAVDHDHRPPHMLRFAFLWLAGHK